MIKFNRIGYKLGLTGAVGVLLSIGMVTNQMVTESSINAANYVADTQQSLAAHTLEVEIGLRKMEMAVRSARLAKTPDETEKAAKEFRAGLADQQREIEAALALVNNPENKERLQKIKSMMVSYAAAGENLVKTHGLLLRTTDQRSQIVAEWAKSFEALLGISALAGFANHEAEKLLYQIDSKVNGLRAAVWGYSATGEESQ